MPVTSTTENRAATGTQRAVPLRTWKTDPTTGDLDVSTGRVVAIDGVDAVAQILLRSLKTFLGEHFTARQTAGLPIYQEVLGKGSSALVLQELFAKKILASPGVTGLNRLDLDVPEGTRTLVVTFEAVALGATISGSIPLEI